MKSRIDKTFDRISSVTLFSIYCFLIVSLLSGWSSVFNVSTPASQDNPAEADDRMREIKAAVQEREDVDHYWPLTLTLSSDPCTGEHRKLTLNDVNSTEIAALTSSKAYLYRYVTELYYKDSNGTDTTQITRLGYLNLDDSRLGNNTYLLGRNAASNANINIIKVNASNTLTLGAITTLPDGSSLTTSAAPVDACDIAPKKYVDDQDAATLASVPSFGTWTNKNSANGTLVQDAVYKVGSDGFVLSVNSATNGGTGEILSDGSNPPTTVRFIMSGGNANYKHSGMIPVKKDDYWKITTEVGTEVIYWLPLGSGTCVLQ
jgi:hypothetical protein